MDDVIGTVLMRVQQEYDIDVLGTNYHPINWPSCIVNCPEKTNFIDLTNDKGNLNIYKPKYALNEPKCVTFLQNAYPTRHCDAD